MSLKRVSLAISKICNIGCTYCTVRDFSYKAITKDNVEPALKWIQENSTSEVDVYLGYKEPLTDFEFIKEVVELRKTKYPNVKPRILTNAVLMDEEKAKYLYDNKEHITTTMSLDGKDAANFQRATKNGKQISTILNFDLIFNKYKGLIDSFSVVLSPINVQNLHENIMWMVKDLGVRGFVYSVWTDGEWKKEDIDKANEELNKIYLSYVESYGTDESFVDGTSTQIAYNIASKEFNKEKCGAGITELSIDGDGNIFSCATAMPGTLEVYAEQYQYKNKKADWVGSHMLGNIAEKDYSTLNKKLYQDEFEKCNACPIKNTCVKCRIQYEAYDVSFSKGSCELLFVLDSWLKKTSAFSTKYDYYKAMLSEMKVKYNSQLIKSLIDNDVEYNEKMINIYVFLSSLTSYSEKIAKSSKCLLDGTTYEISSSNEYKDIDSAIFDVIKSMSVNLSDIKTSIDLLGEKYGV